MDFLVAVDRPERDDSLVVTVFNTDDEKHARLAAYYYVYGANEQPTWDRVRELTTIEKQGGICNAKIYINKFRDSFDG